jgi:hypothetical protein
MRGAVETAFQRRFARLDGERGEDSVGQDEPQHDADSAEDCGGRVVLVEHDELTREHARCRDDGEEAGAAHVIPQVCEKAPRIAHDSQQIQRPDECVRGDVQPEERVRDAGQAMHVRGDGNDAGRHYHAEAGGREVCEAWRSHPVFRESRVSILICVMLACRVRNHRRETCISRAKPPS